MSTVSDLIKSATDSATASASVKVGPSDSRCRYWAKVIRAGSPLPLPSAVTGARDIPGPYLQLGEEELYPGDVLIDGEENHHRKARGWTYNVAVVLNGQRRWLPTDASVKAKMKEAGAPAELLAGSGELAACVRAGHAVRLGIDL